MNNQVIPFNFENHQVRTLTIENEPWFVAKDVCEILEHSNSRVALQALDSDEKGVRKVYTLGGEQEMQCISESGLYALIMRSNKPQAKGFRKWITSEVIPSIRKHGAYMTPGTLQQMIQNPDFTIGLLQNLKVEQMERQRLEDWKSANESKVAFANAIKVSQDTILVRELAKLINQSTDERMGGTRLFQWLRDNGYLIKTGSDRNMPTQRSIDQGLFVIKETVIQHNSGKSSISKTSKVTGKGQEYFINKFRQQLGVAANG